MKKLLLLSAALTLILTGCNKDNDGKKNITVNDLAGQWSAYENIVDGKVEPAPLDERLSYMEFKTNGTYVEYDYWYNSLYEWDYTLENNVISTPDATDMLHWQISNFDGNTFVLTDEGYVTRYRRSQNVPMLFLEPSVKFGASVDQIKKEERRELLIASNEKLTYKKSNYIEKSIVYVFENNKMTTSGVLLSLDTNTNKLIDYLSQNYNPAGMAGDLFVFESKDTKYHVVLGVETSGFMVMYTNVLSNKSKTGIDIVEQGKRSLEVFKQQGALD